MCRILVDETTFKIRKEEMIITMYMQWYAVEVVKSL